VGSRSSAISLGAGSSSALQTITGWRWVHRVTVAALMAMSLTVAAVGLSLTHAQAASTPWNTWQPGVLSSAHPKASYTFTVGAKTTVRFVLGDLGANYKLTLLNKSYAPVASSDRPGVQSEEIVQAVTAGTYHVVVTSPAKQYSTAHFALKGHAISGLAVLSSSLRVLPDGGLHVAVDLYNTTSVPKGWNGWVKFYDANGGYLDARPLSLWGGAVLPKTHGYGGNGVANWNRLTPPRGWATYKITDLQSWSKWCISNLVMPVTNMTTVTDPSNAAKWRWSGLVRNKDTRTGQTARMAVAGFDSRGSILSASGFYRDVAAGEAVSWAWTDYKVNGLNRTAITSQQYGFSCDNV
jgi:hypothetical protein